MEIVYLGIDVGNTFSEILSVNEECEPTYSDRIGTLDEREWSALLGLYEGCEIHAAFEVCTNYGWLYDLLKKYCVEVVVIDPGSFSPRKSHKKTDKVDVAKITAGLWRGDLPAITVPDERVRTDRLLVAHLHKLSGSITRVKTRVRTILLRGRLVCPFTDIVGTAAQKWMKEEALSKLDDQEKMIMTQLLDQLELLLKQQKECMALAAVRVEAYEERELAQSIPGFGKLVTLAMLSAIAGIARFETADQLASYLGVCGRVDQSGESLHLGPITRRGNKHARWLLGQAVTHLLRKDPKARKRFLKLRRKKKANVARVALMRWLVTVLWRMLTNQEKYRLNGKRGEYLQRKVTKPKAA